MIVVTGGAGFIGSAFVAKLNAEGVKDIIVVDDPHSTAREKNLANKSYREFIGKRDFIELARKNVLPKGITAIVHMLEHHREESPIPTRKQFRVLQDPR
jgi:ADP-L-glycero-D-manno-heptose 6-epimerase